MPGHFTPNSVQKVTFAVGRVLTTGPFFNSHGNRVIRPASLNRLRTRMLINTTFTAWEDRYGNFAESGKQSHKAARPGVCLITDWEV